MDNSKLVEGMATVLADLEERMESLQIDLSPMGEHPVAPKPALQQLDFVTQALGDLYRLCKVAEESNPWSSAIDDSEIVKLECIREGLRGTRKPSSPEIGNSGDLMLF